MTKRVKPAAETALAPTRETEFESIALEIVATLQKLETLSNRYLEQGAALGRGTPAGEFGGVLTSRKLFENLRRVVLVSLPTLALDGSGAVRTQARFSR